MQLTYLYLHHHRSSLTILNLQDRVRPFAVPVSEQNEYTPDVKAKYAEVITHPMDLRQIAKASFLSLYKRCEIECFISDVFRMWKMENTPQRQVLWPISAGFCTTPQFLMVVSILTV